MRITQKTHDLYNQYLLDSIDFSGYELEIELKTNQQLINQLFKTFEKEGGWQVDRIGLAPALSDWLSGLPSCINIDFANYDIIERAKKYGSLAPGATEKDQDKLLSNYWDFMANKLIKLHNGRGVKALLAQAV